MVVYYIIFIFIFYTDPRFKEGVRTCTWCGEWRRRIQGNYYSWCLKLFPIRIQGFSKINESADPKKIPNKTIVYND